MTSLMQHLACLPTWWTASYKYLATLPGQPGQLQGSSCRLLWWASTCRLIIIGLPSIDLSGRRVCVIYGFTYARTFYSF